MEYVIEIKMSRNRESSKAGENQALIPETGRKTD
jgi:hypothetical protein